MDAEDVRREAAAVAAPMEVSVAKLSGEIVLHLTSPGPQETVEQLKARIHEVSSVPPRQQRLSLSRHLLEDDVSLADCGIPQGVPLTLVVISAFDAFSLAECNLDVAGLAGQWRGFWREVRPLRAEGAGEASGLFFPLAGLCNKRPSYQSTSGAVLYFDGHWRIKAQEGLSSDCLVAEGSWRHPLPPPRGWTRCTASEQGTDVQVIEQLWLGEGEATETHLSCDFEALVADVDVSDDECARVGVDGIIYDKFVFHPGGALEVASGEGQELSSGSWEKGCDTVELRYSTTYTDWGPTEYVLQLVRGADWAFLLGCFCVESGSTGLVFFDPPPAKLPLMTELARRLDCLPAAPSELRLPRQHRARAPGGDPVGASA